MPSEKEPSAHATDVRLARGCGRGDSRAIARFERDFMREVPSFIARISRAPEFVDEVLQRLRERLLVRRPDGTCRIDEYEGRGPLGGWVRVAAVRVALDLKRERSGFPAAADLRAVPRSADLELVRRMDGAAFRDAVTEALASLESEERTVLRLRYVDGLTVDKIGRIYGVHGATIVRRLGATRERVLLRVRDRLFHLQKMGPREVASLADLVQSQLELSLTRLFGKSSP